MAKKDEEKAKRNQEIREKYSKGVSSDDLAEEYGISKSTICAICGGYAGYALEDPEPDSDTEDEEDESGKGISEWVDDEKDVESVNDIERVLDSGLRRLYNGKGVAILLFGDAEQAAVFINRLTTR